MGAAPPPDGPPLVEAGASASGGFDASVDASTCSFSLGLPKFAFVFGFNPPPFAFPPKLPGLNLAFSLSCDLSKPVDVTAKLEYGGGRTSNAPPDPDLDEAA